MHLANPLTAPRRPDSQLLTPRESDYGESKHVKPSRASADLPGQAACGVAGAVVGRSGAAALAGGALLACLH